MIVLSKVWHDLWSNKSRTVQVVLVIALGLFYLVATVFPSIAGLVSVGLLFVLPALFHYFVWGRWMERVRQRVLAEEARVEAEAKLRKS